MVIRVSQGNAAFFEALGSKTRLRILEVLARGPSDIKGLARTLDVSPAITTRHVQQLEQAGLLRAEAVPGARGMRKVCSLAVRRAALSFAGAEGPHDGWTCSIPVGRYAACDVRPTCGLASQQRIIGSVDDPRYFEDPEHVHAALVWWGGGWVEWRVPNYLPARRRAAELRVTMELCAEAPGWDEAWPSPISFSVNGTHLGTWTCPGDFGAERGLMNPAWWPAGHTQHGLLKTLSVTRAGSFLDGIRLSGTSVGALAIRFGRPFLLRVSCPEPCGRGGGVTVFGRGFGNYGMDIEVAVDCEPPEG